eukprot:Selendium_serpulae@DN3529_c0_g1_i1.p1
MVLSGANSFQQANAIAVVPTDYVISLAKQLQIVMIGEALSLLACLVLGGIWVIAPICACGCGYYAIKDNTSYKPGLMQMFFYFNVFSTAFGFADWAVSLSKVLGPRNPTSPDSHISALPPTIVWTLTLIVLVIANRMAWVTYKNMLTCSPSMSTVEAQGRGGYGGGGQGPGYATSFAGGGSSTQYNNPTSYSPQQSQTFQPFQGQGHRLGT